MRSSIVIVASLSNPCVPRVNLKTGKGSWNPKVTCWFCRLLRDVFLRGILRFPLPFQKSTISNSSSNKNAPRPVKQVLQIRAGMFMASKQIPFYVSNFSLRVFNRFGIRDTGYALFEGQDSTLQVKWERDSRDWSHWCGMPEEAIRITTEQKFGSGWWD